jgi:hypothetical protein
MTRMSSSQSANPMRESISLFALSHTPRAPDYLDVVAPELPTLESRITSHGMDQLANAIIGESLVIEWQL